MAEIECCCLGLTNFQRRWKCPDRTCRRSSCALMSTTRTKAKLSLCINNSAYICKRADKGSMMSYEEIELKCYSLSPDRLIVDSDKRCRLVEGFRGLTRARPLSNLEDGRKHLDVRRPESMCRIKFKFNPKSGKIERRLSFHGIDDEENDELIECHDLANRGAAKCLSSRSFVLIERAQTTEQVENVSRNDDSLTTNCALDQSISPHPLDNQDAANSIKINYSEHTDNQLEQYFISSVSIETPQSQLGADTLDQKERKNSKRKRKRRALNFARRFVRMLGSSPSIRSNSPEDRPIDKSNTTTQETQHKSEATSVRDMVKSAEITTRQLQTVARLDRPDSVYLWPEKLQLPQVSNTPKLNVKSQMVMISYNHTEGKEFAIELHAELERLGVSAYLDLYDIQKGQDWQDSLNFAILNCRLFIPLVTPSYGETLWTSRECKLADVLGKRIIPINFGQKWPPPSLAIQFATLQYIDWLQDSNEMALRQLRSATAAAAAAAAECNNFQRWQQQLVICRSPGPLKAFTARWPSESVQSIARQLEKSFQMECNLNETYAITTSRTSSASQASSNHNVLSASKSFEERAEALKLPSSHSDSGYESPCIQQPVSIQNKRTETILANSLARSPNKPRNKLDLSSAVSSASFKATTTIDRSPLTDSSQSSNEPNSAEMDKTLPPHLYGFKLAKTSIKSSNVQQTYSNDTWNIVSSQDKHNQGDNDNDDEHHDEEHDEKVAIVARQQGYGSGGDGQHQKRIEVGAEQAVKLLVQRKKSLSYCAKRVLGRVKRSLGSSKIH